LIGNGFGTFDADDLDFYPVTPQSIGFLCYPGRICGQSLRKVGQGVLQLFIGNKKVTDGQTDQPTDMCKAIIITSLCIEYIDEFITFNLKDSVIVFIYTLPYLLITFTTLIND